MSALDFGISGLLLALMVSAPSEAPPQTCTAIETIRAPTYGPRTSPLKPALRSVYDLFSAWIDGEGTFVAQAQTVPSLVPGVVMLPLPFRVDKARRDASKLIVWPSPGGTTESMTAFILASKERWCTGPLDLAVGARLRFEGHRLGAEGGASISLAWEDAPGALLQTFSLSPPGALLASEQVDFPLVPTRPRSLCFQVQGGPAAIGEARILVPDGEVQEKPRVIVLIIVDTLRADIFESPRTGMIAPAMARLAQQGAAFSAAISPGCHTRAAVWSILMGRDLLRIDPSLHLLQYAQPLDAAMVYARGNVALTQALSAEGYHSVFLGNNDLLTRFPAFDRFSSHGDLQTGTNDTVAGLPQVLARYADEPLFLTYYLSTPHARMATPARLLDGLGCKQKMGLERCRCFYEARVKHADEAVAILEQALADWGLLARSLQVLTADHGETFADGPALEAWTIHGSVGAWQNLNQGHGMNCRPAESRVPLVFTGPHVQPGLRNTQVSTLDIMPTILERVGAHPVNLLDGMVLPLTVAATPYPLRPVISQGQCSITVTEGDLQLLWWRPSCSDRRDSLTHKPETKRMELYAGHSQVAQPDEPSLELERLSQVASEWVADRRKGDAIMLDLSGLTEGTIKLSVPQGRIVDFGPSGDWHHLAGLTQVTLSKNQRDLTIRTDNYAGLYYVATSPPDAAIELRGQSPAGSVVTLVGAHLLPLELHGRPLDPSQDAEFFFAAEPPELRLGARPRMAVWWQRPGQKADNESTRAAASDFQRVLRAWGYIR